MGSNDDVTVYQAVLKECDCSAGFTSAPVDIARNLLLDNCNSNKLKRIPPGKFKPWYGKCAVIDHYLAIKELGILHKCFGDLNAPINNYSTERR